jgi:hypothetical protein
METTDMTINTHPISTQQASPSKPVATVLSRLKNVAEISAGWTARCPCPTHNDNVNSLSIAQGADGRALLYCHAGCAFKKVVAALGIHVCDLFVNQRGPK